MVSEPSELETVQQLPALRGLGRAVILLLLAAAVVDVFALWAGQTRIGLLDGVIAGEMVDEAALVASDETTALVGQTQVALWLLTGLVYLAWFRRAHRNATALVGPLRQSSGWAVGAWFVPVLNLVRPKQMHDDVWRASATAADASPEAWRDVPRSRLVTAWWAAFLFAAFLGRMAALPATEETAETLRSSSQTFLAADLFGIVTALLAWRVVRTITARQDAQIAGRRGVAPVG